MMTGYEAFTLYHVLKLHFTGNYDYFKYNGKSKITVDSFENRKDKYHFYKLSRKFETEEYKQFLISVLLEKPNAWAGDLLDDSANELYLKRKSIVQALGYHFKNDCNTIKDTGEFDLLLKCEDGQYPKLLELALHRDINIETLCILNSLMNFFPMWQKRISDTIIFPEKIKSFLKYTPFLEFDKVVFKKYAIEGLK